MNTRLLTRIFAVAMLALPALAPAATIEERRGELREQSREVLERLYQASPGARDAIAHAAGYATFSNFGLKLGVAGTGKGKGLAKDTRTGKETFMRFVEVQAGVGVGIKKYDLVFVFDDERAATNFVDSGWEYGGQATAALKHADKGEAYEGAISVSPGVWLYQVTSTGLAAELTFKSSKYYQDGKLN